MWKSCFLLFNLISPVTCQPSGTSLWTSEALCQRDGQYLGFVGSWDAADTTPKFHCLFSQIFAASPFGSRFDLGGKMTFWPLGSENKAQSILKKSQCSC